MSSSSRTLRGGIRAQSRVDMPWSGYGHPSRTSLKIIREASIPLAARSPIRVTVHAHGVRPDGAVHAAARAARHADGRLHLATTGFECQHGRHRPDPTVQEVIMSADERRFQVLRAIVSDYVATQEPVGSTSLVERHALGVSPATVRNDMAVLEDEGYIRQPHTSAGRVPTDSGYRLFVDRLAKVKPRSPAERRAIERFLLGAVDLDDVVHRTVRLLAQLTRQVAVVQYPSLSRASVRHFALVPISTTRLMVVMIAETRRGEQRPVDLPGPILADDVTELRRRINEKLVGKRLVDSPPL